MHKVPPFAETSISAKDEDYEKKIRIASLCHPGVSLCDVFVEQQK
jgi:hypothetical protein